MIVVSEPSELLSLFNQILSQVVTVRLIVGGVVVMASPAAESIASYSRRLSFPSNFVRIKFMLAI